MSVKGVWVSTQNNNRRLIVKKWKLVLCSVALGALAPFMCMTLLIHVQLTLGFYSWLPNLIGSVGCLIGVVVSLKWYREFRWTTKD